MYIFVYAHCTCTVSTCSLLCIHILAHVHCSVAYCTRVTMHIYIYIMVYLYMYSPYIHVQCTCTMYMYSRCIMHTCTFILVLQTIEDNCYAHVSMIFHVCLHVVIVPMQAFPLHASNYCE